MDKSENVYLGKNEILANMYALRAGLSVVAVNGGKVNKAIMAAIEKAKKDEAQARAVLKEAKSELQNKQQAIAEAHRGMEERKRAGKAEAKANEENANRFANHMVNGILKTILYLIGVAACVYVALVWPLMMGWLGEPPSSKFLQSLYGWVLNKVWSGDYSLAWAYGITVIKWVMFVVSLAAAAGSLFLLFFVLTGKPFTGFHFRRDKRTKGMKSVKQFKKEIEDYERSVENLHALIPIYEGDIEKARANGKAHIAKTCQSVAPTSSATMALYKALQCTFSSFLDERDWDNLDLLTYYIETGRADTVKESLQLLDRQKQTEQIVVAVSEAAGAICRTVNQGLRALQADMHRCFNILSNQITTVGRMVNVVAGGIDAMGSRLSSIEGAVANQNAQISQMVSATNLNNALRSCANESSAKLVAYTKTCADNSRYIADAVRQAQIGGRL